MLRPRSFRGMKGTSTIIVRTKAGSTSIELREKHPPRRTINKEQKKREAISCASRKASVAVYRGRNYSGGDLIASPMEFMNIKRLG